MRTTVRSMFGAALQSGHDAIVITAFGCGFNEHPPSLAAPVFHDILVAEYAKCKPPRCHLVPFLFSLSCFLSLGFSPRLYAVPLCMQNGKCALWFDPPFSAFPVLFASRPVRCVVCSTASVSSASSLWNFPPFSIPCRCVQSGKCNPRVVIVFSFASRTVFRLLCGGWFPVQSM
jgi:hypothetical protein